MPVAPRTHATPAREDLDLVIAWLKSMPNVGAAPGMVAALRDVGEEKLLVFLVGGANTLVSDMSRALTLTRALA